MIIDFYCLPSIQILYDQVHYCKMYVQLWGCNYSGTFNTLYNNILDDGTHPKADLMLMSLDRLSICCSGKTHFTVIKSEEELSTVLSYIFGKLCRQCQKKSKEK